MYIIVGQGPEKMRHGTLKTGHGTQGGCTRLAKTKVMATATARTTARSRVRVV